MKKLNILLIALLSPIVMWAQQGINYQAVVRDGAGAILVNQSITAGFDIEQTTAGGTVVYSENHAVTTNAYGLINVIIGEGTLVSGDFTTIDWGADKYFVAVSIDGTLMGTTEFKWVPYSLHAQQMTNIKPNTANADVEITSTDAHAVVSIRPTTATTNDSSTLFLGEGSIPENGMAITYDGVANQMRISGGTQTIPYMGPYLTIERDSGKSTFTKGIVVEETTSTPAPNTTYGNSGPLAYGFIAGINILTDYGITSFTNTTTGEYIITLDNSFVGDPVVIATALNFSSDTEIITYESASSNTITIRIVDENNVAINSNFSFVVYGIAQ